jgi:hypothetical protein
MVSFILWLILKWAAYTNSEAKLSEPIFFYYNGKREEGVSDINIFAIF